MPENNNDLMNNSQDLNTVSGVENVTKKGGKKAAAIGIGAVVLLAGGGAAAYNFSDLVKNQVKLRLMKPEKYYAWVNEENAKTAGEKAADAYREMLGKKDEGQTGNFSVKYELSDDVRDLLKEELNNDDAQEFKDVIDNAQSIEIGCKAGLVDEVAGGEYFINYNDDKLATIDFALDQENMDSFFRVPELKDQWLCVSLGEAVEEVYGSSSIMSTYKEILKDPEPFLSPDELQDIVERYTAVWNSCFDDVDLEKKESLDISDITVEYTAITVEIDEEKAEELAEAFIEEARDDDVIRGIIIDKLEICDEDEYDETLDEALESFEHEADYEYSDDVVEFTTYVDAKGVIRGMNITMGDELDYTYAIGMDGDDVRGTMYFETDGEREFQADLTAEKSGKAYDGSIDITFNNGHYDWETEEYVDEEQTASIEFTGFEIVNEEQGFFNADVTVNIPDVEPFSINFAADEDSQEISADIKVDGTDYGKVTAKLSVEKDADVEVPSKDDAFVLDPESSDVDFSEYVSEEEFKTFVTDLAKKVGFEDELAEALGDEAVRSAYNSGSVYGSSSYDDDWDDDDWDEDDWDDDDFDDDEDIEFTTPTDEYEADIVEAEDDQAYVYVYDSEFNGYYSGWSGSLAYKATVADIKGDGEYTVAVTADTDGYRAQSNGKSPKGLDTLSVSMYTDKYDVEEAELTIKSVKIDGQEIKLTGQPEVENYGFYLDAPIVLSGYGDDEDVDLLEKPVDGEWTTIEITFELKGVKES
ncbi:MAG: hypothetical protein II762_07510 [Ruminococcus sp.]|nr:hypothetical protein [Ruminococcus sp.]